MVLSGNSLGISQSKNPIIKELINNPRLSGESRSMSGSPEVSLAVAFGGFVSRLILLSIKWRSTESARVSGGNKVKKIEH